MYKIEYIHGYDKDNMMKAVVSYKKDEMPDNLFTSFYKLFPEYNNDKHNIYGFNVSTEIDKYDELYIETEKLNMY